jgi:enoyl-CoA hydratase
MDPEYGRANYPLVWFGDSASEHVVNRLVEPGSAVEAALELAAQLSKNGPLALAASKRILEQQFDWPSAEMWDRQGEITQPVMSSEDAKEGASAFKEKRAPVWKRR